MSSCTPGPSERRNSIRTGKPKWLRRKLPSGPEYERLKQLIKEHHLHTVCNEAKCPNQFECYGKGTATFMILGEKCTRDCGFCNVGFGPCGPPDADEPARVAEAVELLGLRYAVITSVTRDDLADGGARHFARTIEAIRERNAKTLVEVLIPDFKGDWESLKLVLDAEPNVLNHNIETVAGLYGTVRPQAIYERSLALLAKVKELRPEMVTKSGLMVGLGESLEELEKTWADLHRVGCDILTMGQYLQPSADHLEVERFLSPEEFAELECMAAEVGFAGVASGPFVRSSYEAEKLYRKARIRLQARQCSPAP